MAVVMQPMAMATQVQAVPMVMQPMMPIVQQPIVQQPAQPQVTVINTGGSAQQNQAKQPHDPTVGMSNIRRELAKIRPHELNQVGKANAAARLRGLIGEENERYALLEQEHLAKINAAEMMCKQLEPKGCCTIM